MMIDFSYLGDYVDKYDELFRVPISLNLLNKTIFDYTNHEACIYLRSDLVMGKNLKFQKPYNFFLIPTQFIDQEVLFLAKLDGTLTTLAIDLREVLLQEFARRRYPILNY